MDLKLIVDLLASIAAIVAIVASLVAWYQSARRPLVIDRVVVHRKEQAATFILMVKNVKSYPISIKQIGCYKRKKHQVQRKWGRSPEYSATFSSTDMIFDATQEFQILPNGHTDIRIEVNGKPDVPSAQLFLLRTSHGFLELWCKEIEEVEIEKVDVYNVDYQYEYNSAWRAKPVFWWKCVLARVGKWSQEGVPCASTKPSRAIRPCANSHPHATLSFVFHVPPPRPRPPCLKGGPAWAKYAYNHQHRHGALGGLSLAKYVMAHSTSSSTSE